MTFGPAGPIRGGLDVLLAVVFYTGLLIMGVGTAGVVAWFLRPPDSPRWPVAGAGGRRQDSTPDHATDEERAPEAADFHVWLRGDSPINSAAESLLPSHTETARRILGRLAQPRQAGDYTPPSVALIGPYGSGKTSICNLVRSEYEKQRAHHPDWPTLLFCRFEAWRYLTPEAALRGLIGAATDSLLEHADECCFWTLGEQYVQAAREAGLGWTRAVSILLGGGREPGALLNRLGDLLVRINCRLVIFVDDLDRIEEPSPSQQHAIVQALNQFQSVANVQYLLTAGPTHWSRPEYSKRRAGLDLLKLTRFQELVPELETEQALGRVRELRTEAKSDHSVCFPWAEGGQDRDPLEIPEWSRWFRIRTWGYADLLMHFLTTPRQLKAALRETHAMWQTGLKAEINWYHLLLANALKVAEPGVFEWILRDKDTFLSSKARFGREDHTEREQEAQRVQKRLKELLEVDTDVRHEAVTQALGHLFPVFGANFERQTWGSTESSPQMQDLASNPAVGGAYLYRFAAGRVPDGDLPDRPHLQYVRRVLDGGFDRAAFEHAYLASYQRAPGLLHKLTQFSSLLGAANSLGICDAILGWAAQAEPIKTARNASDFFSNVVGFVYRILSHFEIENLHEWLARTVAQMGRTCPLLAARLIHVLEPRDARFHTPLVESEHAKSLRQLLATTMAEEFVTGGSPLAPVATCYPFALCDFVGDLMAHPEYERLKEQLTRKLVSEAELDPKHVLRREVLLALTSRAEHAVMDEPVPADAYTFAYDKGLNDKRFDMPMLLPVLRTWHNEGSSDPLTQRLLREVASEYGFGNGPLVCKRHAPRPE